MLDFLKRKPPVVDHSKLMNHESGIMNQGAKVVDFSKFNKVINFCLYALVLLVPVLFTSLTTEVRDFNKLTLIFFGVVIMLAVWVIKILTTRSVSWVKTSLDYILLVYLLVYLLTSLMSIDKVSSFLGYYGRFTGGFISVLSMVLFYFLLVNNLKREHTIKRLINFFLVGSGLVLLYSFLQLLGAYVLPMAYTHARNFNPIGSLAGLAIFAAICVVFIQWQFFTGLSHGRIKTIALWVMTLLGLAILFLINAFVAWLVLALAMVAFLAVAMAITGEKQTSPTWFWKPMIILVVSVLFVAFQFLPSAINPRNLVNVSLPIEVQLSNSTTWTLAGNSIKSGAKTALLGSGPGTTGIVFGQIKPAELNQTVVWSLNFDRASSEIANIVIETGVLGLLVFELLSLLFLVYGLYFLLKKSGHVGWNYAFGFFVMWLALYITHFFYFYNSTFTFLFWLSIGVFMAVAHMTQTETDEQHSISFSSSPRSALSWMFVSLLLLAAILIGAFFQATLYGGEVVYANGLKMASADKPNSVDVSNEFARAANLNPYRDVYFLTYGQSLIVQAQEEAAKAKPDTNVIQNLMSGLIAAGQAAVAISPAKASNWQALSQFYADIKPLAADADKYVISSLKTAIEHDSNNPALHYQLGQAYFSAASVPDTSKQPGADGQQPMKTDPAMMKSAIEELNKAIELKNDLPEFYIQLARILESDQKLADAKTKMDDAVKLFPQNPDVLFEDGRLAFNQKNLDEAAATMERVVALNPDYANAHYSLGLIAQQKGDKVKALAEFQKVRDILVANKVDTTDIDKAIAGVK